MSVFTNSRSKRIIEPINCGARGQKKTVSNEEARQKCRFSLVETHKRLTSIAVLTVHAETSLLYSF